MYEQKKQHLEIHANAAPWKYINSYFFLQIQTIRNLDSMCKKCWHQNQCNWIYLSDFLSSAVSRYFLFPSKLLYFFFWVGHKRAVNSKVYASLFTGWVVLGNQAELQLSHNQHWLTDVLQNCLTITSIIKRMKHLRKLPNSAVNIGFLNFWCIIAIILILTLIKSRIKPKIPRYYFMSNNCFSYNKD